MKRYRYLVHFRTIAGGKEGSQYMRVKKPIKSLNRLLNLQEELIHSLGVKVMIINIVEL